jgi:hypothetical protein
LYKEDVPNLLVAYKTTKIKITEQNGGVSGAP